MDEVKRQGMIVSFMYGGIAIALIVSVVSSFVTFFSIINYLIPSDLFSWYQYRHIFGALSSSVSFLAISFGVLCYLSKKVRKLGGSQQFSETVYYKICHAIILFVLILSFLAVAISSATLLAGFLGGDISLGYAFKSLFVIGVGAMVFFYYRGVLRGIWRVHQKEERIVIGACTLLISVIVIVSLVILNPFERRSVDETFEVLEAVQLVSEDINSYYRDTETLPVSLKEKKFLDSEEVYREYQWEHHLDNTFTYEKVSRISYRICASFPSVPTETATTFPGYPYGRFTIENTGETCFDIEGTEDVSPKPFHRAPGRF